MYSGNWLKGATTVQARPTALPGPDPAHGKETGDQYPQDHKAPVSPDYSGTDFGRAVVQTPGLVLDAPGRSHDGPGRSGVYRSQVERQAAQALGHVGEDRGWVRSLFAGRQSFQDDTTRYLEQTWTGNASPAPSAEAVQRSGLNSLPQNNPHVDGYDEGGFRRGLRNWRFVDRKNRIDQRVYTAQQLLARGIVVPGDAPAQKSTWGRSMPFGTGARAMSTVATAPGIFRSPGSLTEAVLEGAGGTVPSDGGIATDGMWAT